MKIYRLNDKGRQAITNFIRFYGRPNVRPEGWYEDAENERLNMDEGYAGIIEIGAYYTLDNIPHILHVDAAWFDSINID